MPTYVVLTLSGADMALSETTQRLSDASCYVEQSAMATTDSTIHLWISCDDCETVADAFDADPTVSEYEHVRTAGDEQLYAVTTAQEILLPREILHSHDGAIREAYASAEQWTLEVRFLTREDLSAASEDFERYGIDVTFQSIESATGSPGQQASILTDEQREALEMAMKRGYFDIPREATLKELAEELDVSHQALSERIRRAYKSLATTTLSTPDDRSPSPNRPGKPARIERSAPMAGRADDR